MCTTCSKCIYAADILIIYIRSFDYHRQIGHYSLASHDTTVFFSLNQAKYLEKTDLQMLDKWKLVDLDYKI